MTDCINEYGFPIVWNPAFELATDQVPADFRGAIMTQLARQIAPDGVLNTAKIEHAVVALKRHPESWTYWGTEDQTLQYLKQIWHVLVFYRRTNR